MKRKVTLIATLALAAVFAFALVGCGSSDDTKSSSSDSSSDSSTPTGYIAQVSPDNEYGKGKHTAKVSVKGYDSFTIELDADSAPVSVANFCALANKGFYDGLTFHRIVENFCLQGGDPQANGTGGSDNPILGEFSGNNVENKLADNFKNGTVAMARMGSDMNSATSQFFITLGDTKVSALNGQYAAFGTVDATGMKTVDKIVSDYIGKANDASSGAISDKADQPVITKIEIVD